VDLTETCAARLGQGLVVCGAEGDRLLFLLIELLRSLAARTAGIEALWLAKWRKKPEGIEVV